MMGSEPQPARSLVRYPKTWPPAVSAFFATTLISQIFPVLYERPSDTFGHVFAAITVGVALGISLFASRTLWWIFSIFVVAAIASDVVGTTWHGDTAWLTYWQSWVTVILQSAALILVLTPTVVRWILPFGPRLSLKVQYALIALVLLPVGLHFAFNPLSAPAERVTPG